MITTMPTSQPHGQPLEPQPGDETRQDDARQHRDGTRPREQRQGQTRAAQQQGHGVGQHDGLT